MLPDLALARAALDRAAHRRTDEAWLDKVWQDPATRVLLISGGRAEVTGDPPVLVLRPPNEVAGGERFLLGVDDADTAFFAIEVPTSHASDSWQGIRDVGVMLSARDAGLLVHAVALANWHDTHTHCPRCGGPTTVAAAGHLRRCPRDDSEHYPRTDPAVIMTVVDSHDRLLLGSQSQWPEGRFSTLAGFVEPGESMEAAVRREVAEEVGVTIGAVRYLGSQPWPFPSSLMVGFEASADTVDIELVDGEIAQARWFTRAELLAEVTSGEVRLSPRVSIARQLIESWYGEPLPDPR
ncbi:MAG: NAD(+) diphosphatase [Sporichthyaceae bacterium]